MPIKQKHLLLFSVRNHLSFYKRVSGIRIILGKILPNP